MWPQNSWVDREDETILEQCGTIVWEVIRLASIQCCSSDLHIHSCRPRFHIDYISTSRTLWEVGVSIHTAV